MCVGKRHGAWIGRVDRRRTALAWAGPGGCMDAEGSPCPRCAVVGIVAGTVACMPRALDEEMARVIRLVCALLIVLEIGSESCRARVWTYGSISVWAGS